MQSTVFNSQPPKLQSAALFNTEIGHTSSGDCSKQLGGKKWLLATSLHLDWTHQANRRWRAVSYCTEWQAAGSALRPGLIFYLHSFLLRIFRTIFPPLYSQQTTKRGPNLWNARWMERKTSGLAPALEKKKRGAKRKKLNRFSHPGRSARDSRGEKRWSGWLDGAVPVQEVSSRTGRQPHGWRETIT